MKLLPFLTTLLPSSRHVAAVSILLLAGCKKDAPAGPPRGMGAMGPVPVNTVTVTPAPLTLTQELPGRVSAFRVAEVRARASGVITKRFFEEGAKVREGQQLYQIDPAPLEAALASAQATLAKAEAGQQAAALKAKRFKDLLSGKGVSQQDFEDAAAAEATSSADVMAGKAAVETARINLGYTTVNSPIDGRIGLSRVTEGAFVRDTEATLLATVQQLDPVYVDVTQSTADLFRLKQNIKDGRLTADENGQAPVTLVMEDGTLYPETGKLSVSDITVNETTSSVVLRAVFPNPRNELLPGLFVRARFDEGTSPEAILVPQSAVTRNTKGEATTLVIGEGGTAELRILETPRAVGNRWLVTSGLMPGDRVIVSNLQLIRPGSPVTPAPAPPSAVAGPETSAPKSGNAG